MRDKLSDMLMILVFLAIVGGALSLCFFLGVEVGKWIYIFISNKIN